MAEKVYRQGRMIFLSGEINSESSGEVINHLLSIIAEDDDNDKKQKDFKREEIKLYIKSNGGTVTDMFGMIDLIESSPTPINTYAIGNIASAATSLFLSGKKRYIYKNTDVMMHSISGGTRDMIQNMVEDISRSVKLQDEFEKYILSKTKVTKEKLKEIRERKIDWYLDAEECIKYGVATDII